MFFLISKMTFNRLIWDPLLIGNYWVACLQLLCSYQVIVYLNWRLFLSLFWKLTCKGFLEKHYSFATYFKKGLLFIWDPMLIGNQWVARLPLLCSYQVSTRCCSHVSLSALLCSVNMIFSLNNYRQTSKAQETEILTNILSQTKQSTRNY